MKNHFWVVGERVSVTWRAPKLGKNMEKYGKNAEKSSCQNSIELYFFEFRDFFFLIFLYKKIKFNFYFFYFFTICFCHQLWHKQQVQFEEILRTSANTIIYGIKKARLSASQEVYHWDGVNTCFIWMNLFCNSIMSFEFSLEFEATLNFVTSTKEALNCLLNFAFLNKFQSILNFRDVKCVLKSGTLGAFWSRSLLFCQTKVLRRHVIDISVLTFTYQFFRIVLLMTIWW